MDFLKVQLQNGDHILENAEKFYDQIPTLQAEEKRLAVEDFTSSILIDGEDITINFRYAPVILPLISQNTPTREHINKDSVLS